MYSAELEKHKKEKDEWRRKALLLEDQASALQVNGCKVNAEERCSEMFPFTDFISFR